MELVSDKKSLIEKVKICPLCKEDLRVLFGVGINGRYHCTSCDYEGTFFLEKHEIRQ